MKKNTKKKDDSSEVVEDKNSEVNEKIMNLEEKNDFLKIALNNNQKMINFADSKANIFITIQSLLITIGIAGALISDTFVLLRTEVALGIGILYIILLFLYIISSFIGIIFAATVFSPRGPTEEEEKERKGLFYYAHISKFTDSSEYSSELSVISKENLFLEFSQQIYQLAKIAKEKMDIVKNSFKFLFYNIIFTVVIIMFTVLIHLIWGN